MGCPGHCAQRHERDLAFEQITSHPHDYSKDRPVDFALQQELRAAYARMTPEQRREVQGRGRYARALLQTEPEVSGMTPSDWNLLKRSELEKLKPDLLPRFQAEELAVEAAKQSLETVRRALRAEAVALGGAPRLPAARSGMPRIWK